MGKQSHSRRSGTLVTLLVLSMLVAGSFTWLPTLAQVDPPTEVPTVIPTDEPPTVVPTEEPIPEATDEPPPVSTEEPQVIPTDEPPPVPTDEPMDDPTAVPTDEPAPVSTDEPAGIGSVLIQIHPGQYFAGGFPDLAEVCIDSATYRACAFMLEPSADAPASIRSFMQVPSRTVTFEDVPVGEYEVVLQAPGYDPVVVERVGVVENETALVREISLDDLVEGQPPSTEAPSTTTGTSMPDSTEECVFGDDAFLLALHDPTEDGIVTIAELRQIAESLPEGDDKNQFQNQIAEAEASGVTGIRYDCAPLATGVPSTAAVTATTAPVTATTTPFSTIDIDEEIGGTVEVRLEYLGQAFGGDSTACEFGVSLVATDTSGSYSGNACNNPVWTGVPPGAYVLRLNSQVLPEVPLTVVSGETVSHTFDVSEVAGVVSGVLTVNGQPPAAGRFYMCVNTSFGVCQSIGANGRFELLVPAGSGYVDLYSQQQSGQQVRRYNVEVVAGQTTGIGSAVVVTPTPTPPTVVATSTVTPSGTVTPGGEACVPEDDRAFYALVDPTEGDGVLTIADLQTIASQSEEGSTQRTDFEAQIAQAQASGITGIRYDLVGPCPTVTPTATPTVGDTTVQCQGIINDEVTQGECHVEVTGDGTCQVTLLDGEIVQNVPCSPEGCPSQLALDNGNFYAFQCDAIVATSTPPTFTASATAAPATATPITPTAPPVTVTVAPVSTIDFDVQDGGNVAVQAAYLGQPAEDCNFSVELIGNGGNTYYSGNACANPSWTDVRPGAYVLTLYAGGDVTLQASVMVVEGETVSHTFELSEVAGIVSGTVTINGQPPPAGRYQVCVSTSTQACQTIGGDGQFDVLVPAGIGYAEFYDTQRNERIGFYNVGVVAGQTTGVGSAVESEPPPTATVTATPSGTVAPPTTATVTPEAAGNVVVSLEPADIPDGSEVCLVSESDEFCAAAQENAERPGMRAFSQPSFIEIPFQNLPFGMYQVILRAPGHVDLVLDEIDLQSGQLVTVGPVSAGQQEAIEPILVSATETVVPTAEATDVPPTDVPATTVPATDVPPTDVPPTGEPTVTVTEEPTRVPTSPSTEEATQESTQVPPTVGATEEPTLAATQEPISLPSTVPPTNAPPTDVPATTVPTDESTAIPTDESTATPTDVPVTSVPATDVPPTDVPATSVPATEAPPTSVPMEEGSVAVQIESDGLPAGSEVCLVNEETGEEICEPVPDSGTEPRPGILAFRQATLTVTFENVPVGTWRLVLRVPGFEDLVINETVTVTVDQVTDAGEIPADVEEQLEPVTPPGQMPTDVLIRLLIALLISILTSFGSR